MPDPFVPPEEMNISERLSKHEGLSTGQTEAKSTIKTEETVPFDIKNLTKDQLQALKLMLNATPDNPVKKKGNVVIKLREIDGKIVTNFTKVYFGLVRDHEQMKDISVPKIKVSFHGEEELHEMLYSDFINAPQKRFETTNTRVHREEFIEGEVISAETGQLVDMVRVEETRFYTVVIDGEQVELHERLANA